MKRKMNNCDHEFIFDQPDELTCKHCGQTKKVYGLADDGDNKGCRDCADYDGICPETNKPCDE